MELTFGNYIKSLRIEKRITLRNFSKSINYDPSNWSKIERNILEPPKSKLVLLKIADVLGVTESSEEYKTIYDLTVISSIPKELFTDEKLVEKLPVLFRTIDGIKPDEDSLNELIKLIKKSYNE